MILNDRSVPLGVIINSLVSAASVVNKIAANKELSKDDLVECELVASQFKKDFGEELLKE